MSNLTDYYYPMLKIQIKRLYQLGIQDKYFYKTIPNTEEKAIESIKEYCHSLNELQYELERMRKIIDLKEFEDQHCKNNQIKEN